MSSRKPVSRCGSAGEAFAFHHFPQLDGLRGYAITLVVAGHVLDFGFGSPAGTHLGGLGVLLFFVLSGFLITGLLEREKRETGGISLSRFFKRRFLRVFPAMFCYLLVLCLVVWTRAITDTTWYSLAACLLYVRNIWGKAASNGHLWSLSLEGQFYLIWPWIMRSYGRSTTRRIATGGVVAISLFRMMATYLGWWDYNSDAFYERPWFRFDSVLIGCAAALWLFQGGTTGRLRHYFSGNAVPALLWPCLFGWTLGGESLSHVWYLTVETILAALILLHLLIAEDKTYLAVFSNPALRWLGRISYSWYLWQQLFTVYTVPTWLGTRVFPFNIGASLVLAVASYRFIETPFLRLKDRG